MAAKTVKLVIEDTGDPKDFTNDVQIWLIPRKGDDPAYPSAESESTPGIWLSTDNPVNISYGDDENPYLDGINVAWSFMGLLQEATFRVVSRGDAIDNALNTRDTFSIILNKVKISVECTNSNESVDTIILNYDGTK